MPLRHGATAAYCLMLAFYSLPIFSISQLLELDVHTLLNASRVVWSFTSMSALMMLREAPYEAAWSWCNDNSPKEPQCFVPRGLPASVTRVLHTAYPKPDTYIHAMTWNATSELQQQLVDLAKQGILVVVGDRIGELLRCLERVLECETIQHEGHLRTIFTVLSFPDRERTLQYVARLDVVAEVLVCISKIKQRRARLLALRAKPLLLLR